MLELVEEVLRPRRPYPFPWPFWRFLDADIAAPCLKLLLLAAALAGAALRIHHWRRG